MSTRLPLPTSPLAMPRLVSALQTLLLCVSHLLDVSDILNLTFPIAPGSVTKPLQEETKEPTTYPNDLPPLYEVPTFKGLPLVETEPLTGRPRWNLKAAIALIGSRTFTVKDVFRFSHKLETASDDPDINHQALSMTDNRTSETRSIYKLAIFNFIDWLEKSY